MLGIPSPGWTRRRERVAPGPGSAVGRTGDRKARRATSAERGTEQGRELGVQAGPMDSSMGRQGVLKALRDIVCPGH